MQTVTKVVCQFIATEFDEDGRIIGEKPVALGGRPFIHTIYYPFSLDETIAKIDEDLNAQERTPDL